MAITRNTVPTPRKTPLGASPLTMGVSAAMKEMVLTVAKSHTPACCLVMFSPVFGRPANDQAFSCGRRANAYRLNLLWPLRAAPGSCNGLLDRSLIRDFYLEVTVFEPGS